MPKQTWRPDTCGCVIIEDVKAGVVSLDHVESKCAAHAALTDQQVWDAVYGGDASEQKRKNKLYGFLFSAGIANLTEMDAESGSTVLKKGVTLNWSWSGTGADRVITLWLTGFTLSTQQKNSAQTWCNGQFGAGKVVIA